MRTFNRVHFSHVMHSQNKCTRLRCAGMKTLPLHAEWRGTIGLSVPRNSTSNWAIATCLTRVFSCHPQPKHTHWSVWSSNFNHCSNQNTWSNIDFFFFYLFQCFSKHPDCVFCCLGVELHQCSITNLNTGPSYSIFFLSQEISIFLSRGQFRRKLQIHLMETSWTRKNWDIKHQRIANRSLKTQSTEY